MLKRLADLIVSPQMSLLFVGLLFSIPFCISYHYIPIPAFMGEWIASALGLVAIFSLLLPSFWLQLKVPKIALVFIGLGGIVGIQWNLGLLQSPQYGLLTLSYLVWAFLLVLLGSHLRVALGWRPILKTIAWCLVIAGIYNLIFVGLQIAQKSGVSVNFISRFPSYGALAQRNNFADMMSLVTASLLYLFSTKSIKLRFFIPLIMAFMTMLAFSGSRSSWLYLLGLTALGIVLKLITAKQNRQTPETRRLFESSIILIPLFIVVQFFITACLPDGLVDLPNERIANAIGSDSSSLRLQFWHTAWYFFNKNPWLGIGVGQIRWQTMLAILHPTINPAGVVFEHAHNLFFHLLAEMGIGGTLLVIVGLCGWLWAFNWKEFDSEKCLLISLIGVIAVHSMLEYPLWYAYFLGPFAFLLGVGEESFTRFKEVRLFQYVFQPLLLIVIIIAVYNLNTLYIAYQKLERQTAIAAQGLKPEQESQLMEDMIWVHTNSLLSPYAEIITANMLDIDDKKVNDQLWITLRGLKFMPMRSANIHYAILLEINGQHQKAEEHMRLLSAIYDDGFDVDIAQLSQEHRIILQRLIRQVKVDSKHINK